MKIPIQLRHLPAPKERAHPLAILLVYSASGLTTFAIIALIYNLLFR